MRKQMDDVMACVDNPLFLPVRNHPGDAGADLKSNSAADIFPGETVTVSTGVKLAIPFGYVGLVFGRSGLASRKGIRPANCVGVIDSGYRDYIYVPLRNDGRDVYHVCQGDRIAQLVIIRVGLPGFLAVDVLPGSDRGENGLGSTGA
jgi:dUTP pyrophosphatase